MFAKIQTLFLAFISFFTKVNFSKLMIGYLAFVEGQIKSFGEIYEKLARFEQNKYFINFSLYQKQLVILDILLLGIDEYMKKLGEIGKVSEDEDVLQTCIDLATKLRAMHLVYGCQKIKVLQELSLMSTIYKPSLDRWMKNEEFIDLARSVGFELGVL